VGSGSDVEEIAQETVDVMKDEWYRLLKLEAAALVDPDAKELLDDLIWPSKKCIRLLCMLFERDGWKANSRAGTNYIKALLMLPPDNKLIEDMHAYLRDLARLSRRNVSSPMARMSAAMHSGRLEERGITHHKVTHDDFIEEYKADDIRGKKIGRLFHSRNFELPDEIGDILGDRRWPSPNPMSAKLGSSGWSWLRTWTTMPPLLQARRSIGDSFFTRLLSPMTVTYNVDEDCLYFVLDSVKYMSPALNMTEVPKILGGDAPEDQPNLYSLDIASGLVELHVVDPMRWLTIPTIPVGPKHVHENFNNRDHKDRWMLFQQVDEPLLLLKYRLLKTKHNLTLLELHKTCNYFKLDQRGLRPVVIERLCNYVCSDDSIEYKEWFLREVFAMDKNQRAEVSDLTELALEGLDAEDQDEFKDLKVRIIMR